MGLISRIFGAWKYRKARSLAPTETEARKLSHHKSFNEAHYQHCWQRYAHGRINRMPTVTKIEVKKAFAAGWGYAEESQKQGKL